MPISVVFGNDMSFSFEFTIEKVQQYFDDYTFLGNVMDTSTGGVLAQFAFAENVLDPNLIDVTLTSTETRLAPKEYQYEVKAVNNTTAAVSSLLRGNFNVLQTFVGV